MATAPAEPTRSNSSHSGSAPAGRIRCSASRVARALTSTDAVVTARVGIGRIEAGRYGLAVELLINLPSLQDRDQAQALIEEAEQRCPYSNAVRGNVEVTLTLL